MKKQIRKYVTSVLALMVICFTVVHVGGSTWQKKERILEISAVTSQVLDGTTASGTWAAADRESGKEFRLNKSTDVVDLYFYVYDASETAADTILMNIYGYVESGPSLPIYDACTLTLGTGISPNDGLYIKTASGTSTHTKSITVTNSGTTAGVVIISFDTTGLYGLYFEAETFTGVTAVTVIVHEYGFSN